MPYTFSKIIELSKKYKIKGKGENIIKKIKELTPSQLLKEFKISWFKIPIILWEIRQAQELLYKKIDQMKLFPGIETTLKLLKKKQVLMFIYSSNIEKNINKFLEKHKIRDYFKKIYVGKNILSKDKDLIYILKKENLKKEEVLYVADEIRDVLACKKAGIKIVGVSWGSAGEENLAKNKADFLIKKPKDLIEII